MASAVKSTDIAFTLGALGFSLTCICIYVFELYSEIPFGYKPKTSLSTNAILTGNDTIRLDDDLRTRKLFDVVGTDRFSRFIRFNVTDDGTQCKGRRFLIYTCTSSCAGWGDRLKGITSMFLLAQLTNRTFLIDMSRPCKLQKLVEPNLYDWNKCLAPAKAVSAAETRYSNLMGSGFGPKRMNELIYGDAGRKKVVSVTTNVQEVHIIRGLNISDSALPWMRTLTNAEVIGSIIGILFKPSRNLTDALIQFKTEKVRERRLVCSHIRIGRNPTLPSDARMKEGEPNASRILHFLKNYDRFDDVAIFVSTDSMAIRNRCLKFFSNFVSTNRGIVHVDFAGGGTNKQCDGFFAALLDQLILSRCDVLVLTRSNFGAMAAYMRGESGNLFLNLKHKTRIVNVTVSGVQDMYSFV